MSSESAKKKRLGSRRRVANPNKTSEADEFHVTDSSSVAQRHIPEENTESLNVLANPEHSPELAGNRRKLGSSRRKKKVQHVKESATESYHDAREEVEEKIRGNETLETTRMSLAIQPERQEGLGSEHDIMSATHDSSLYSATVPDFSHDIQSSSTTHYPETDVESLILESEKRRVDQDENETDYKVMSDSSKLEETMLGGKDKSDARQSEEVKENVHPVGISELTSLSLLSSPIVDQQLIDQFNFSEMPEEELPIVYSVTEKERKERDEDTELLRQGGNLQGNVVNESHVEAVVIQRSTTPEVTTDESSPREDTDLECSVEQADFSSPKEELLTDEEQKVRHAHHSEDAVNKVHEREGKPTEMLQTNYSFETLTHDATENFEIISGNLMDQVSNAYQSIERTSLQELSHESECDIIMPATHDISLYTAIMPGYSSEVQTPTTTNCPDTDLDSLIPKSENLQEDHDKRETDFKVEVSNKSVGATLEGMDKSDTLQSQDVRGAHHSEDAVNKVHEQEVEPTEIQEMPQIVTYDATENFEIISGNLMEQAEISDTYQSEFIVKSTYESDNKQSNSDDKQDEHPMKVNNFEALDHRNEDYHIYDTKKPQISDIEWEDTALGQVYETEGRVEDDAEPSAEQTLHQEKEGLFSETEESESSLQTLQSEIHAPLDSQPQQTDAGFNPIGNRRKLGSSRRNKGRQHVKDSVAESCHRPTEEVVGTTRDNEPLETTKMSLTIETTVQEKSMETMQEGMDKFDTHQTEEVGDQIQNALVGISELNSSTLHPSSTVDQLINQTNSTEMPEEELPYVYSVTEKENKERDEDAELLRLDGNLPENYLVSESHLKSEDIESSITPAISTDKHSPREHTEPKCSVEQADFSSPKQELPTNDEQNQILNLSEVGVPYQSEDAVNKVPEQDFKPTQMQEIAYSSESVIHDATENSEIISGNLMDQAEVSDTYQSELIGKSTDESAAKQEDSNPDDKHDDPPTKDRNFEALENRNEDYHNIKKPQISDIKRVDTALGQVYEGKDQVEDDIKSSAEQTGRQDKEGVFSDMEESESSLQTLQSERNISLDSQPQQTDTGFNPIGNRRKLGSSRRNKGRHHVKESVAESYYEHKEEVVITTSANESLETTQMLLAIERTNLEELSQGREHDILMPATHDRSLYTAIMPGYSSEVQTPTTTNYPETDLDSLIPKSENLQEDHVEREFDFKVEVSNKSVGATLEGMDKSDTLQSQDVRGAHHSEDAVNKVHEQEVEPTEIQEMPQIDYSSKSVTYEATEKFEIISGNLMEQAEISDTYQSELIVKSTDESAAKHEDSNPDDKHDDPPTKERNFEALDHRNEDYHNIKKPQMSVIKTADTAVGQVYEGEGQVEDDTEPSAEHTVHQEKEGLFSEMEEDRFETAQTEEVSDQVKENAHLVHISELNSSILHPSPTADQQMIGRSNFRDMPEELPYLYSITEEEDKESDEDTELLGQDGYLQEHYLLSESHLKSEDIKSSVTPEISTDKHSPREHTEPKLNQELPTDEEQNEIFNLSEVRCAHNSAVNKVHEQEVEPTQMQEMPQIYYSSESVTHDATERSDSVISGNLIGQTEISDTYQSELTVKSTDDSATKEEISNANNKQDEHPTEQNNFEALDHRIEDYRVYDTKKPQISDIEWEDTALGQVYETEGRVEDDTEPTAEQTLHQEKEGLFSETEESESSLQTLQSEIHAPLDSQPQQTDAGFNPIGNRRKLGSSRRNKGRQHVKDSVAESCHRPTEEVVGTTRDNEPLETTKMSLTIETTVQEKSMETMQEGMDKFDTHQVKENVLVGNTNSSTLHPSSTVDKQLNSQTNATEMTEEELPNVYSVTEKENKERDEDTELLRLDGNLLDNYLVSESHLKLEDIESSITTEINTEKSSPGKHNEIECNVEQEDVDDELSPNEEQNKHENLSQDRGARHSEDAVSEVHEEEAKPTQTQERPQTDYSSESKFSLQTLQSEMHAPLDSQPLDNSQCVEEQTQAGFKSTGNRKKLGSSRRNKGRQHVSVTETYNKPKEEFVENTRGDEALETTKISLGMETRRQEELKEQTDQDLKLPKEMRKIRSTVNDEEKMPEDDTILSVMDNSTFVKTDNTSSSDKDNFVKSNKDINEEEMSLMKESENLSQLTGNDLIQSPEVSVWRDDSDIQNISHHDDNVPTRSITLDVLVQEEAPQVQNTEASSCDKDSLGQEMNMQQTNDAIEAAGDVMIKDYHTEAENSIDVQVSGQDEIGETFEDPTKKDCEAQEMNASQEITHAALNKTDTLAPFDIGLEDNFKAERAVDVSEESGINRAVGASNSQQGIREETHLDNSENSQGKSKQKRRKMGSTRQSQLNRKPEGGMDNKEETKESKEMEELPMIVTAEVSQNADAKPSPSPVYKEQETNETSTVHDKGLKLQSSTSDLQSIQSDMMSDVDDLKVLLPEQSASHNEEAVNAVKFLQVSDVRDSERNVTSQLDQKLDSNTEDNANSGITGGSSMSLCETTQSTQNDEERPESVNIIQDQALKSAPVVAVADFEIVKSVVRGGAGEEQKNAQGSLQELNNVNEEAQDEDLEMKNASPNLNSTNRRRKMGSSRRNLGSRTKGQDLHQKRVVDNDATETATNDGDVKTESFSSMQEKELQPHTKHKDSDSEQRKERVFETVEYSHTGESHFKPPAHQTFEENPVSHGQLVETEHQLPPSYHPAIPSTSPKHDVMSELASGGRRRKMGSHRKSRGHQNNENQTAGGDGITDTQNGRGVGGITGESATKRTEEESLGKDKLSEVNESDRKASSNISTSKAGERSRPVSEKTSERGTPVQHPYAEIRLNQESQKTFSLDDSRVDLRSNSYNVVIVGDSSVGKTSFIKRAQSGKFSLDLPASLGLDSYMWTVVVDGKPVALQLWDTAGQERFHSITRQIFHKAQAFLLMYDITSSQSFSAVSYWASCIQEGAAENVTILLVGNKSDHAERQVKTQQGEILAKEYNFEFMECSAATGENVVQSLETLARMLSQKVDTREEAMVLHKEPQQKKSSGCC